MLFSAKKKTNVKSIEDRHTECKIFTSITSLTEDTENFKMKESKSNKSCTGALNFHM